jgi:prevent-host-death family protein
MNVKPPITIMTSREFNQDTAKAKRAARKGPVYITERGQMSHVLLSKEEYERLKASEEASAPKDEKKFVSLADMLHHPESAHIDFEIPRMGDDIGLRVPDLED